MPGKGSLLQRRSGARSGRIAYNAGMSGPASARELASAAAGGRRERPLYDEDFWSWTQEQAGALLRRDLDAIDWENLIEEIETLGRSEQHASTSYCANVV